eukprot:snap_masked-scaffold_3-processed-gene-19.47-mRNA-1 protein AED:1.00 eAED:1.00 QI:0/0/0/0/1/1/2/0/101
MDKGYPEYRSPELSCSWRRKLFNTLFCWSQWELSAPELYNSFKYWGFKDIKNLDDWIGKVETQTKGVEIFGTFDERVYLTKEEMTLLRETHKNYWKTQNVV